MTAGGITEEDKSYQEIRKPVTEANRKTTGTSQIED